MRRGRKPKPTDLKLFEGNRGKRNLNTTEPKPKRARPAMPAWLAAAAKTKWRALVPKLLAIHVLTEIDGDVLAGYCQAWAEFRQATMTLQSEGRFQRADNGRKLTHPAVAMQRTAMKALQAFSALLGLDPSSRSRLNTGGGKTGDELDQYLAGSS